MKKLRTETICMIGILTSIIIFLITCHFQIKDGYARDAGIYVSDIISNLLWILLVLCIVFIGFFLVLPKFSAKKYTKPISIVTLIILITTSIWIFTNWQVSFEKLKNTDINNSNIRVITLAELEKVIKDSTFQIVYIGRNNCPLCEYVKPKLITYIESENLEILYYNTQQDRENNRENMDRVLNSIPVQGVPFIMVVENGIISARFMGENIVNELSEYINIHKPLSS